MKRIVVGVDGSGAAAVAVEWAVELAAQVGATLHLVSAFELRYGWIEAYEPDIEKWRAEAQRATNAMLDDMVDNVSGPNVEITRAVVEAPAARALFDESKDADLLVVGSRGLGGFKGLLLGSVSQQCVQHSDCPVVVVPSPA